MHAGTNTPEMGNVLPLPAGSTRHDPFPATQPPPGRSNAPWAPHLPPTTTTCHPPENALSPRPNGFWP
jgi:hypothetical protein